MGVPYIDGDPTQPIDEFTEWTFSNSSTGDNRGIYFGAWNDYYNYANDAAKSGWTGGAYTVSFLWYDLFNPHREIKDYSQGWGTPPL